MVMALSASEFHSLVTGIKLDIPAKHSLDDDCSNPLLTENCDKSSIVQRLAMAPFNNPPVQLFCWCQLYRWCQLYCWCQLYHLKGESQEREGQCPVRSVSTKRQTVQYNIFLFIPPLCEVGSFSLSSFEGFGWLYRCCRCL